MKTINSKGISTVAIIGIIVIVLLAGGLVWWQVSDGSNSNTNKNNNTNVNISQNVNTNSIDLNTSIDTTGWKEYINTDAGFSITIPSEWYRISEWDGSCCSELDPKDTYCVFGTQQEINMVFTKVTPAQSLENYLTSRGFDKYVRNEAMNSHNVIMRVFESPNTVIDEDTLNRYIVIIDADQDKKTYIEFGFNVLDNINKKALDSFSFLGDINALESK